MIILFCVAATKLVTVAVGKISVPMSTISVECSRLEIYIINIYLGKAQRFISNWSPDKLLYERLLKKELGQQIDLRRVKFLHRR